MKHLFLLFITAIMLFGNGLSQSPLDQGQIQANFGLGIDDQSGVPLYAGLDFSVAKSISVGGVLSYVSDFLSVGGNVNYHFDDLLGLPPFWNAYAGVNAGFLFEDEGLDDAGDGDNEFGLGIQAGGRYFLNDRWGLNLELNTGKQVGDLRFGATLVIN